MLANATLLKCNQKCILSKLADLQATSMFATTATNEEKFDYISVKRNDNIWHECYFT